MEFYSVEFCGVTEKICEIPQSSANGRKYTWHCSCCNLLCVTQERVTIQVDFAAARAENLCGSKYTREAAL